MEEKESFNTKSVLRKKPFSTSFLFSFKETLFLSKTFYFCFFLTQNQELRETLLSLEFNECILLFSGMSPIDIEKCLQQALRSVKNTPPSITTQNYSIPESVCLVLG